ncbi:PLAC8-domain-containing protein [Microthyrium microscopicum]|uniref:PLAC8-domain-containing protein n=1 Tax=Microthyrium microscopicum TaxID=703497 RepID=A0A6A6TUD1_9PEZI|nr:PLAC8-domain-containing protein [Microthyrium microscopicum]
MPAPAASNGPIDNNDIDHWKNSFNRALGDASGTINSKSPEGASSWHDAFFGCFSPIDVCLMTWCCSCVTFGKVHHRLHKSETLEGYEPINTSCLMFVGSSCVGLHWLLGSLQRSEVRQKYNLEGSCITDIAASCCCALCSLVQQEKEVTFRQAEKSSGAVQYSSNNTMTYDAKDPSNTMAYDVKN